MDLAMIGLGRMGANMAERMVRDGHRVVGSDPSKEAVDKAASKGIEPAASFTAAIEALPSPKVVWLMVPAGQLVDKLIAEALPLLSEGDIVIDGGNSMYKDSVRRGQELSEKGIKFVDVGTSGGVWGLQEGYSMMVGGSDDAIAELTPALESLAPAADKGWGHVGPCGSGHFTKMVHNGIEYGMMQAYAEGFAIMERKKEFDLDLHHIAQIWQHGSVVRSWLLDLTADALDKNPTLKGIAPYVSDSGEGRWTVAEAIDLDVSAPVITLSLLERLRSREDDSFSDKLLSAMRNEFGGHAIKAN